MGVFAEHLLEHLTPDQAVGWLGEVRRVLKPGGLMRVTTPDLLPATSRATWTREGEFFAEHRERLGRLRDFSRGGHPDPPGLDGQPDLLHVGTPLDLRLRRDPARRPAGGVRAGRHRRAELRRERGRRRSARWICPAATTRASTSSCAAECRGVPVDLRRLPQRGALPARMGRVPPSRRRRAVLPLQQPQQRRPSRRRSRRTSTRASVVAARVAGLCPAQMQTVRRLPQAPPRRVALDRLHRPRRVPVLTDRARRCPRCSPSSSVARGGRELGGVRRPPGTRPGRRAW